MLLLRCRSCIAVVYIGVSVIQGWLKIYNNPWRYLSCGDPVTGIDREHPSNQVMSSSHSADLMLWVVSVVDLPIELLICAALVGEVANQHDEHHDPQGPNIGCLTPILLFLHDFWGHIAGRSTENFDLPSNILTFVPFSMQVLKPKSINLSPISPSIIIFSNFISLCAIFFPCK